MADLIRKCTVERGFDPRNFALIAYGGAGPTHVASYSADVNAKSIYILPNATVFSAFGILTSPITHYVMVSRRMGSPYSEEYCQELTTTMKTLSERVKSQFSLEKIPISNVEITNTITMRYKMQVHEIEVEVKENEITHELLKKVIIPRFENKYSSIYGTGTEAKAAGTEIITCKVVGQYYHMVVQEGDKIDAIQGGIHHRPQLKSSRKAFFEEKGRLVSLDTAVYEGNDLSAGDYLEGPSIVERYGDAIVMPPGYRGTVDSRGTISLTK
jgi:N-methylhydantoinase A